MRRYEASYDYLSLVEHDLVLSSDLVEARPGLARFLGRLSGDHLGGYVADRFSPTRPLTVELGLRYDRPTLTRDTLLSPRVNLAWRVGEASVVRAAWGHFYQSQRPYELQVEDGETRFHPAERSEHWVLGCERLLGRHEGALLRALRVELYRREIDDPRPRYENLFEPVNTFPEAEVDRVRIVPDSSRAEGVEVMLQGSLGSRADWWLNYAYASAKDRIRGQEVRRQIDQTHTLNLYLHSRLGKNWNLSVAWRYHTGWPTTPVSLETVEDEEGETRFIPVLGPLNSDRLGSYHRLDLRASREWQRRGGRFVFFVDLQNLYNRENPAGVDLEVDEEAGRLIKEPEAWPGLFPSVGITWEF
jgi:outer membrane receptor protein involved in Fe transport